MSKEQGISPKTSPKKCMPGNCDICWMRDGSKGMKLHRCSDCGVCFHFQCYGWDGGEDPDEIQCWACQAIGKVIKGRRHGRRDGPKTVSVAVTSRPTECCLCSVDDKDVDYHCMHPLFDDWGTTGRQIILPPNSKKGLPARPAWVHSLCALTVAYLNGGCIYGCTPSGSYDEAPPSRGSGDSVNSELLEADEEDQRVHHFVYTVQRTGGEEDAYYKAIREHKEVKCAICGKDDSLPGVYRIPVQCCANDSKEFKEFRKVPFEAKDGTRKLRAVHSELLGDTCFAGLHVGCAMWGKNEAGEYPIVRRAFFYPGIPNNKSYPEVVANVFCATHAKDLEAAKLGAATVLRYPESRSAVTGRPTSKLATKKRKPSGLQSSDSHQMVKKKKAKSVVAAVAKAAKKKATASTADSKKQATASATVWKKSAVTSSSTEQKKKQAAVFLPGLGIELMTLNRDSSHGLKKTKEKSLAVESKAKKATVSGSEQKKQQIVNSKMILAVAASKDTVTSTKEQSAVEGIETEPLENSDSTGRRGGPETGVGREAPSSTNVPEKGEENFDKPKQRVYRISEAKRASHDSQREKWFSDIVNGIYEEEEKCEERACAREVMLEEHKKRWKEKLRLDSTEFQALWDKVLKTFSKDGEETAAPSTPRKRDWSMLVVGRNYDPEQIEFSLSTWDEYETYNRAT